MKKRKYRYTDYLDYMQSPAWKELRRAFIRHHQSKGTAWCYKCRRPFDPRRFQVHHLHYNRLGQEKFGDLRLICEACHIALHAKENKRPEKRVLDKVVEPE